MSLIGEEADPPPGFCAAPWIEGVLSQDHRLRTCCRNSTVFGDWFQNGLAVCWQSTEFQLFREKISAGVFPDEECRRCYANGTASGLSKLARPFDSAAVVLLKVLPVKIDLFQRMKKIIGLMPQGEQNKEVLRSYFMELSRFIVWIDKKGDVPFMVKQAVQKLFQIGRIATAFLAGDSRPAVVASFRQVNLIAVCNARCIQCPGLYTGTIINGGMMSDEEIARAFSCPDHMVDFFMNGTELLFYPDWKNIAAILNTHGVKFSLSTNGILLTEENIRYLIDNEVIHNLNISIDGATEATVESIRVNVNFRQLLKNIEFLFAYSHEKNYNYVAAFSFVLMKRNYQEFPRLVELIHRLYGTSRVPAISVYCQALESYRTPRYQEFVQREHHSFVARSELIAVFDETTQLSKKTGIPVRVFYSWNIDEFVKAGYPFPPLL
ncbi:MAG: radical SAM protein [Candidatus Omnitrophica bacterium]|nr:radical SAM protein [Candidatus Omnitrophota bacterium]